MKQIIATIKAGGDVKVQTVGFEGAECLAATAKLEEALGAKTAERKTDEFFKAGTTGRSVER